MRQETFVQFERNMFVRHTTIVQLLLLYCIIVQNYVLCDVGSKLTRKNAESEISGETARRTKNHSPKSSSDLTSKNNWLFINKLESVTNKSVKKQLEIQFPLLATEDREINTVDNVSQHNNIRDIRSNSGDRKRNYVKVSEISLATDGWVRPLEEEFVSKPSSVIFNSKNRDEVLYGSLKETKPVAQPYKKDEKQRDYGSYLGWTWPFVIFG